MILPTPAELLAARHDLGRAIEVVADAESALLTAKAHLEDRRSSATLQGTIAGNNDQARKASDRAVLGAEYAAVLVAERNLNTAKSARAIAELHWLYQQALMRLAEITASPIGEMIRDEPVDPRLNMEVVAWATSEMQS